MFEPKTEQEPGFAWLFGETVTRPGRVRYSICPLALVVVPLAAKCLRSGALLAHVKFYCPTSLTSMKAKTVQDLFLHELSDTYNAEKQMTRSLPKMARASTAPDLAAAFEQHLEETRGQVERIDKIVELTGLKLKRLKCAAMEGLIEESQDLIDELDKGPLLDIALMGAAQKAEHYEIASYTTLVMLAGKLGLTEAATLLEETLAEEKATDEKLGLLAQAAAMEDAIEEEQADKA